MSENIWKNFENFWNKNEIKQKSELYHNYFENPNKEESFSWINEKDKDSLKKINISKSMKWGIPNHILGDIDNSKFIIGLLNPGINMKQDEAENCNTVGEYIEKELKSEKKELKEISFPSKEVYEKKINTELNKDDFYYNHILSKENVLSQELKKLYKIYNNDNLFFENMEQKKMKNIGYYFSMYFKGVFNSFELAKNHYKNIFEKMEKARVNVGSEVIQQKFEEALLKMPITNIELIPYRTEKKPNQMELESSKISANAIIEKIIQDQHTIVILRSYDTEKGYNWKNLLKEICEEKNIDFKSQIEPSIYIFVNPQNGSISKQNIKPANSNNSLKTIDQVIEELNRKINLSNFENELDSIIESNNKR
ncbi:TPA: hypothetical protein ACYS2D_001813 [Staphylococcus aureus]|nr:hypothetical protein [Staphylococcus aureus]MCG2362645.1 hypothetical protein [Staphylococcus epidermidis]MBW8217121.1 hypothetical protein [Staphylococcus aureus]MBW8238079.1 hypothetical protein [Staphylococcus aureus]MBY0867984.1 hypothetical protein [Staphylococcus aureus]MDE3338350.1 hypothetical protein [Staphylococcus aureus]